jgi:hypothetical protein
VVVCFGSGDKCSSHCDMPDLMLARAEAGGSLMDARRPCLRVGTGGGGISK